MATSLGGVTLAEPLAGREGCQISIIEQGAMLPMANGNFVYSHVGIRYHFLLRWGGITTAERATIVTQCTITTSQTLVTPYGTNATVICLPGTIKYDYQENRGGTAYWWIEAAMETPTAS